MREDIVAVCHMHVCHGENVPYTETDENRYRQLDVLIN